MEKIKPYDNYKHSGNDWLGEIPEHWVEFKPKTIGYLFGGLSGKKGDDFKIENEVNISPYIPFTNIANNFIIDRRKLAFVKTIENEKQNTVKKNDLLLLMSSENFEDIGKTSLLNDDIDGLYLNSFCKGFRITDKKIYPKFLNYLFSADINRKRLSIQARGFTRINLKIGKVNDLSMFAPQDKNEQITIANFLDYKTAKIDRFIRKKKLLIKLLNEQKAGIINHAVTKGLDANAKMKPSSVKWLGDIPVHWEVKKLKYIVQIEKRIAGEIGFDVLSITQKGIKIKDITSGSGQLSMDYSKYQFVKKGYFAMNHMDLLTGFIDISAYDGVISPDYRVFKSINTNCYDNYLLTLFQLGYFRKIFYAFGRGVSQFGRWRLPSDEFYNFQIPVPPIREQKSIVEHIEKETEKLNKAIATIEKEIALVQEYRTALIAEAVTGKIDVREYKVPVLEEEDLVYEEVEEELDMVAEDGEGYEIE